MAVMPVVTPQPQRSLAATSAGAGSSGLTIWIWNAIIAPRSGLPEMPAEVAGVLTLWIADLARQWMGQKMPAQAPAPSVLPPS